MRITNWYLAASSGLPPAMIWPDIMPGIVTMPAEARFAIVGSMPRRIDDMIDGRAASHGVAPSASKVPTSS